MPAMPDGAEEGILRGIYKFSGTLGPAGDKKGRRKATILFSGSAWRAAVDAQKLLADNHNVDAELFSVTSYKALREEALEVERWNRLHPTQPKKTPYITDVLLNTEGGPFIAVSDFMKMVPDTVSRWVPGAFTPLGTDGFGRSDTREALRSHFEIDAPNIVLAVLDALAASGEAKPEEVDEAIDRYDIDPDRVSSQEL